MLDSLEAVFDPRLGLQGGSRYREPRTGRFAPRPDKKSPDAIGMEAITFRCKFCGEEKPLDEMRTLTRFFPYLTACRECERRVG